MRWLVVLVLSLAGGCTTHDEVPFEDFEDLIVAAYCDRYMECAPGFPAWEQSVYADAEECSTAVRDEHSHEFTSHRAYDPSCAAQRIDSVRTWDCTDVPDMTADHEGRFLCESGMDCNVFYGELREGHPCEQGPVQLLVSSGPCGSFLVCDQRMDGSGTRRCIDACEGEDDDDDDWSMPPEPGNHCSGS
jgi:hypothetical protein